MAEVFPPAGVELGNPDWGFNETPDANVTETNLGDGYVSRQPVGINHIKKTYNPTWSSLSPAQARQAYDFLVPRLKLATLLYTHPITGAVLRVVAKSADLNDDQFDNAILTVTFETDFNPG